MVDIFDEVAAEIGGKVEVIGPAPAMTQGGGDIFDEVAAEMKNQPSAPTPEETVPEWGRKNPNLYGAYGAAKSLITPVAELTGGFGGGVLGTPLVGGAIGAGYGKKAGEMATRGIEDLMGEKPSYPSLSQEVGKSAVDVGSNLALGKGMDIAGKALYGTENKLSSSIREGIDKAIRPSVKGKGTFPKSEAYYGRAETAVKAIIDNKPNLKLTMPGGEPSAEALPKTLKQFGQAINQTKQSVFEKYDSMAKEANDSGVQISLDDIVSELRKISRDKSVNMAAPGSAQYASKMADIYEGYAKTTPLEAQNAIAMINSRREAFYANPSYENATNAYVDSMVANRLRKSLDDTIETNVGEGYQELKNIYGALSTIEDDVNKRAIVDARKNIKGLIDFSDIFSGSAVVGGIVSLNPASIAAGVTAKGLAKWIKHMNNPNRVVKNLFSGAEKVIDKTGESGPISSIKAQKKVAEAEPYDFQGREGWKIEDKQIRPSGTTNRPERVSEIPEQAYTTGTPERFPKAQGLRPDQQAHMNKVDEVTQREVGIEDTVKEMAVTADRNKQTAQGILKAEFPGMEKEITRVVKDEPELTRIIKQSNGKPTEQDMGRLTGLALKKMNEFRAKKGLEPIEMPSRSGAPEANEVLDISHRMSNKGSHLIEVKNENGDVIGKGLFVEKGDVLKFEPGSILYVEPKYRRKGIATDIFKKAEEVTGKKITRGPNETPTGVAFGDKWFGKRGD